MPPKPEPSTPLAPLYSPNLSQSASPQELRILDASDYWPTPDEQTVIHHPPFNLPSLGIVINIRLRCLICLTCERAINSSNAIDHIHKDLPFADIPEDLSSTLETTYRLVPYPSIKFTPGPISPVFGLPLEYKPMFFCDCGKGYSSHDTLRAHQTRLGDRACSLREKSPGFHKGYGQRLTANQSYFEVEPSPWRRNSDRTFHYPLAFSRSLPPLRDYSKMEIKGAEDEMNTSSFFYTQRWIAHLKGYSPVDIQEVTLESTPEAPFGDRLRLVAEEFLNQANNKIKNYNSFGILKLMGQTTEYVYLLSVKYLFVNQRYNQEGNLTSI